MRPWSQKLLVETCAFVVVAGAATVAAYTIYPDAPTLPRGQLSPDARITFIGGGPDAQAQLFVTAGEQGLELTSQTAGQPGFLVVSGETVIGALDPGSCEFSVVGSPAELPEGVRMSVRFVLGDRYEAWSAQSATDVAVLRSSGPNPSCTLNPDPFYQADPTNTQVLIETPSVGAFLASFRSAAPVNIYATVVRVRVEPPGRQWTSAEALESTGETSGRSFDYGGLDYGYTAGAELGYKATRLTDVVAENQYQAAKDRYAWMMPLVLAVILGLATYLARWAAELAYPEPLTGTRPPETSSTARARRRTRSQRRLRREK